MSEQLVRVTAARCYLYETKVCLLVHSRNRDERIPGVGYGFFESPKYRMPR